MLLILNDTRSYPDSSQQFGKGKRLGNIVVGAKVKPSHPVAFLNSGGYKNEVNVLERRVASYFVDEFEPVHFGNHDVRQCDVNCFLAQFFQRFNTVCRGYNAIALSLQDYG